MKIKIYQVNMERDEDRTAFMGMDQREHFLPSPELDSSIYDCVFDGEVDCKGLEDVFQMFNINHPEGYRGRSLSVSDVVEIVEAEGVEPSFYFCDSIGFKKVAFDPEQTKPLEINEKIRVLMVEPGKKAYEKEIGTKLEELYSALSCDCIQTYYPYEDLVVIVCDDEGKGNGSKPNRAIYGEDGKIMDIICGKFFICDCSTNRFLSLPDDMMQKFKKQFLLPERFLRINDNIYAVKFDPEREAVR